MKDTNMHTGYCTHILYSDNNTVLIVPEAYSVIGEKVVDGLDNKENISMDIVYINECIKMSETDINSKNGAGKENAVNRKKFFEKILEDLLK